MWTYPGFRRAHRRVRIRCRHAQRLVSGETVQEYSEVFTLCQTPSSKDIIRTAPEQPPQPYDYETRRTERGGTMHSTAHRSEHRLRIPQTLAMDTGSVRPSRRSCQGVGRRRPPRERGRRHGDRRRKDSNRAHLCDPFAGPPQRAVAPHCRLRAIRPAHQCSGAKRWRSSASLPSPQVWRRIPTGHSPGCFEAFEAGGTHVVIVTNDLLCTPSFQKTVAEKIRSRSGPIPTMLIADEAHSLGAESFIS